MKKWNGRRLLALMAIVLVLVPMLSGCQAFEDSVLSEIFEEFPIKFRWGADAYEESQDPVIPDEPENPEPEPEPEPAPPVMIKPAMHDVPYIKNLDGDAPIYSGPDYAFSFAQYVGISGPYTIVEEAYDDEGNLWGKLKSGVGWVFLEPVMQGSSGPMSANYIEDDNPGNSYHQIVVEDSDYTVKITFRANEKLKNVQFSRLDYSGASYVVDKVLGTLPELTTDKPLVAWVSFPGSMSTYGISFTDSNGSFRTYAIYTSGKDGSLIFQEY